MYRDKVFICDVAARQKHISLSGMICRILPENRGPPPNNRINAAIWGPSHGAWAAKTANAPLGHRRANQASVTAAPRYSASLTWAPQSAT
jgi:hypothetical protein